MYACNLTPPNVIVISKFVSWMYADFMIMNLHICNSKMVNSTVCYLTILNTEHIKEAITVPTQLTALLLLTSPLCIEWQLSHFVICKVLWIHYTSSLLLFCFWLKEHKTPIKFLYETIMLHQLFDLSIPSLIQNLYCFIFQNFKWLLYFC